MRYWKEADNSLCEGLCGIDDEECEGYNINGRCNGCPNFIPLYCMPDFIINHLGK